MTHEKKRPDKRGNAGQAMSETSPIRKLNVGRDSTTAAVPANTMKNLISRRLFLRSAASAGAVVGVVTPAVAVAAPTLTPDQRINAAIGEIVAAFREKWPDAPLRVEDMDNISNGMVIVLSHVADDKPGQVIWRRRGLAREAAS